MNSRLILTKNNETVKPDLTVPSASSDIRLVAETNGNNRGRRRGFRKVVKNSTASSGTRPARRIKLNRSIFNSDSTAKPTFRATTVNEIKSEKEDPSSKEVSALNSVVVQNTSVANSARPLPSNVVLNMTPSPVTSMSERSITQSPVTSVSGRSVAPSPVKSMNTTRSDTRTVIRRDNNKSLLLPMVKLTRISKDRYKGSISKQNIGLSRVINTARQTQAMEGSNKHTKPLVVLTQHPECSSGTQKRKISPPNPPNTNPSPLKKRRISPIQSPDSHVPQQPPSPLDSPPSPALSLGAQSDHDFDEETISPGVNSRVILSHSKSPKKGATTFQKQWKNNVHSRLGPPQQKVINDSQKNLSAITDDALDVMSVIADDDELFLEVKPNGPLKRSVSQDSIFNMAEENDNRGDLKSLSKKTQASQKRSVGDLIVSKPLSKSFRIPRQNSNQNKGKNNVDRQPVRKEIHAPPRPTRVVSNEHFSNGFIVQEKVRSIRRNLEARNIHDAWLVIKELENSTACTDVRLLEETVRICNIVSMKEPSPRVAEIIMGVFEMLKCRKILKTLTYILTVLTLCHCGKFQEALDKISEMIHVRIPFRDVGVRFFDDILKCLRATPKWIFNLLFCIKSVPNTSHIVTNCLSTLASAPGDVLREIMANQWDSLIAQLCSPPNVQGAKQAQHIMDKHCIPMSDQSITKLLQLYRDTKSIKQLLDLVHLKRTNEMLDVDSIFADENLNLRDIEAHISDLVRTGSLPQANVLNHFIERACSMKEFDLIFSLFRKCQNSPVSLSTPILKKMVDALENWNENINASVEVYIALRQSKMPEGRSTPPLMTLNMPPSMHRRCHIFFSTGRCHYGDRCKFLHERPQHFRQSLDTSIPQSGHKLDGSEVRQQFHPKTAAEFASTTTTTMVNGHSNQHYPSFQPPSFIRPMFAPIANHIPLRIPPPLLRQPTRNLAPARNPIPATNPVSARPPFQNQFSPVNANPRFGMSQQPHNTSMPVRTQSVPDPKAAIPDKVKLNRSFSWEPCNNSEPPLRHSPLPGFHQPSPGSSDSNNNKVNSEFQQRVEQAIVSKNWSVVYQCYVESKQANKRTVQFSDLRVFRSAFVKDLSVVGSSFNKMVEFLQNERSSEKSSHSDSGNNVSFDEYDLVFLGSLGVSLMEKCLVTKKFDKGYEVLHTLHACSISYFDCGKNFGAYTRDIPPSAVAIIAIKLCMGMSQDDGLLSAMEVLRASNYAMPEDNITPENMEYRIKVLQQVFVQLFDQGNICEAYEIIQHLNGSPNVMVPLYAKVLKHYSSVDDFDQSFDILAEMNENGFDLNIPACQTLYEKFLKLCLRNEQDDEALGALEEMESRGILLNGEIWKGMLNKELSTNENIINLLFQRGINLGVYPATFSTHTPWLCQLGCGYSQVEVKLVIVRHLKQLYQHLLQTSQGNLSSLKDFEITLFPRVEGGNMTRKFNEGIQSTINKNGLLVEKVLKEDLNPPLVIFSKMQEQFHSKFIVKSMSLYRWFTANQDNSDVLDKDDDASSNGSVESCLSYITRLTEFD